MSWYRLLRLAMPLVDNPTSINYMDIGHREYNATDPDANGMEFEGRDVCWWIDDNWQLHQEMPHDEDTHFNLFPDYYGDDDQENGIAKGRYSYGPDAPMGRSSIIILKKYRRPETLQNVTNRVVRMVEQAFGPETEVMLF